LAPAYGEAYGGGAAIIEYATTVLEVNHIVVCGHTDCGAIIGLLHPDKLAELPMVRSWLRNSDAALTVVRKRKTAIDENSTVEELIEENVILQLHHLRTHPSVAGQLAQGALALSGWVYDIGHGTVRIYHEEQHTFLPITLEGRA